MKELTDRLNEAQARELLHSYALAYNAKKKKTKSEKQLIDIKPLYVIYARKSTEDDKRQIQSIDDQIDICKKFAKDNNLEVVEVIREEKSAMIAGKRTEFQRMLEALNTGNSYNSILAWHPDRLARNMKESGEIMDMLDNDYIIDLKFPSYTFNNDAAGKMTLSILFAMAKEFSDKLSEDTKRGNKKKVKEGKYMGSSKKGYLPNKNDYFRIDKNTYDIYVSAWEKYKLGESQKEIADELEKDGLDLKTGKLSGFFRDPFSAGFYCYGDQVIDLLSVDPGFKPMISASDFITIQKRGTIHPRGSIVDLFRTRIIEEELRSLVDSIKLIFEKFDIELAI